MIRIAVVEDDSNYRRILDEYIKDYGQKNNEEFEVKNYVDGLDIVDKYNASHDIIFMDIEMKHLDGMKAAQRIREHDRNVVIIFITNMPQYAIEGYKVEAMDYVLKPISAFAFSQELMKAVEKVKERQNNFLYIKKEGNVIRLNVADITYIESGQGHSVIYHTVKEDVVGRESMKNLEQILAPYHFSRCNSGYLVNLAFVERICKNDVIVAGAELQISRMKRKSFMETLTAYIGGE